MKKQIIAAAVAAAFAVPAMAQVTVSGTLETGIVSIDQDNAGAKVTNTSLGAQHSTSAIDFKGTEDLGGGLKASFHLGMEFAAGDMSQGAWDNTGDRIQTSMLSLGGSFGTVSLGTFAHASRDIGGVYRFMGNIGRLAADSTNGQAIFNSADTQQDSLQYVSPTIMGFTASFGKGDLGKTAAGADSAKITTMGISGTVMGAKVAFASDKATTALGVDTKLTTYGGSYDFKVAKLGLVYAKVDEDGEDAITATGIQVAMPVGQGITMLLSKNSYKIDVDGGDSQSTMVIGGQYDFSKRTSLLASYQSLKTGGTDIIGSTRGLGVQGVANETTTGYGVTLVHKF